MSAYRIAASRKRHKLGSHPKIVAVEFPEVEFEGNVAPKTTVLFKRTEHHNEGISMALTAESLKYLFIATLERGERGSPRCRPRKLTTNVRWLKKRNAFVAWRFIGTKKKHRLYRPDPVRGGEHREAKQARARKWADGDSDLSSSDAKGSDGECGDAIEEEAGEGGEEEEKNAGVADV